MDTTKKILLVIVGLILFTFIFGFPKGINFLGVQFGGEEKVIVVQQVQSNEPEKMTSSTILPNEISIDDFKIRQEIYSSGDRATTDFVINNKLKLPYNITVYWFNEGNRYQGWFNTSTEVYPVTHGIDQYVSWFYPISKGDWEVQLILSYNLRNNTVSHDSIEKFRVI